MKRTYFGLATASLLFLAATGYAQALDRTHGDGWILDSGQDISRTAPSGDDSQGLPLGLLLDEDGMPFDEEIIIKDGLIYT